MLKRIYINNYRTFVNFEWQPPPVCVLVGPNGVGKSALMEVLCLLQDLLVRGKRWEDLDLASTRTVRSGSPHQTIEVEIESGSELFEYRMISDAARSGSLREELSCNGRPVYRSGPDGVVFFDDQAPSPSPHAKIPFRRNASFLASLDSQPEYQQIIRFRNYISSMWSLKPDPLRLGGVAASEAEWLERDLTNFASWYRTRVQEDPDAVASLREDLQRALIGFDQIRLQAVSGGAKDLLVRFKFGDNSHELNWAKLSDGQRMLVALYGVLRLAFSKATLVVLDEIENFVAPAEIQPWLREVVDVIAANNQQLIVVSHHQESINYLAADSIYRMWRDSASGHTRIAPLESDRETGEAAYEATKAEAMHA